MNGQSVPITISVEQRVQLEGWITGHGTPQSVLKRARIVQMAAEGMSNAEIARQTGMSRPTVTMWRERFATGGTGALSEVQPGRGRKRGLSAEKVKEIVEATLHSRPKGAMQWSCRTLAKVQGVSPATIQRIWDAHGLKPHRVQNAAPSSDPRFVEKLTDVVGLYLNPPGKAVVLCVDEMGQIQALDRTRPGLPMNRDRSESVSPNHKRRGTRTFFAALDRLERKVVGQCLARHRHQTFLNFLRRLDREFSSRLDLHVILDSDGAHIHPYVRAWLDAHPRFRLHVTPTDSSWLDLIECRFRELTQKRRRGILCSVEDLGLAIEENLRVHDRDPKAFVWIASLQSIIEKLNRYKLISEPLD